MLNLSKEEIKSIAGDLECGFRCFVHRETGESINIPDEMKNYGIENEAFIEEQEKLDEDFTSYFEIEPLESRDSFEIMAAFTEQLKGDERLKNKLINALEKKHPFRNFKLIIDYSGPYRQQWFDFKNAKMIKWVQDKLNLGGLWQEENGGI